MKTDKSKRVGGRRKAGPKAKQTSVARKMQGKPITHPRGAAGYHDR